MSGRLYRIAAAGGDGVRLSDGIFGIEFGPAGPLVGAQLAGDGG
jgi:hypothetical protein